MVNVKKMLFNEDDNLLTVLSMIDVNETPVMFNETDLVPFVLIRKQIDAKFLFDEKLEEYIKF